MSGRGAGGIGKLGREVLGDGEEGPREELGGGEEETEPEAEPEAGAGDVCRGLLRDP